MIQFGVILPLPLFAQDLFLQAQNLHFKIDCWLPYSYQHAFAVRLNDSIKNAKLNHLPLVTTEEPFSYPGCVMYLNVNIFLPSAKNKALTGYIKKQGLRKFFKDLSITLFLFP